MSLVAEFIKKHIRFPYLQNTFRQLLLKFKIVLKAYFETID